MVLIRFLFTLIRLKNWLREKLGCKSLPPLREFVYMEEDAVISLLASTTGGITEQQTTGQKKRISSSITGDLGTGQAGIKSSVGASKEESSEIVRQYVIESNFKELYDMRKDELVISDNSDLDNDTPFAISGAGDEVDLPVSDSDLDELERGNLVEIDVELGSAEVFDYYRVIQAFDDIFETISSSAELRKQLDTEDLSSEEIEMLIDLMEILMADLIPIVGTAKNYGVTEDSEVVVEKEWADEEGVEYEDLEVVGFVDRDNLWLDPTRVLFDKAEFTVFARVDDPVVQAEWMPMKLLDVVDQVVPGIGDDIKNLPEAFSDVETEQGQSLNLSEGRVPVQSSFREDLVEYVEILEDEFDLSISDDTVDDVVSGIVESRDDVQELGIGERLEDLEELEENLISRDFDLTVDSDLRMQLVSRLWEREEVDLDDSVQSDDESYYLEASFVAIYW